MKKYAVFDGRARRKEYWMFFLYNFLIAIGIGFFAGFVGAFTHINLGFISVIYTLSVLIPGISVGVRRMHDTNRNGWWLIVPIIGLVLLFFNGNPNENDYGPDPKAAM